MFCCPEPMRVRPLKGLSRTVHEPRATPAERASLIGPLLAAQPAWTRYLAALIVVASFTWVRFALVPLIGHDSPLLALLPAILIAGYLGGLGPALFASALGAVAATLFFTRWPAGNQVLAWSAHAALFGGIAISMSLLTHGMQIELTRRRRVEAELRSAFDLLREDFQARQQAERRLAQADRRKDEFLAMLAHELRNPLAPIRTIAHVLSKEGIDAATVRRNSELLQRQAAHLTRLVDDLLDVARITRGTIELKLHTLTLRSIIDRAIETVQPFVSLKKQSVTVAPFSPELQIQGDEVRLIQIFGNLLTNASKYSPDGTDIAVTTEHADGYASVGVRDAGVGIDAEVLPHIFDLFMQADRSLDRASGGLGVGLTVVKHLVQLHGGTVSARSAGLDQGSEFVVRLPLVAQPAGSSTAGSPSAQPAEMPAGAGLRILLVEDNKDAAESLALFISMHGHEVEVVHEGASALAKLDAFSCDLVLLDIGLPGMDGYVVAREIRERFPSLRLYALSGYGRAEDRALAHSSGFDGHLTKPVDPPALLALLTEEATALIRG